MRERSVFCCSSCVSFNPKSHLKCKVIPKQLRNCETNQLLDSIFKTLPISYCFLLTYYEWPFIESTDYLFQLVSVAISTCRKKAWNQRKHFSVDRISLPSSGNKIFLKKGVCTTRIFFYKKHRTRYPHIPPNLRNFKNYIKNSILT